MILNVLEKTVDQCVALMPRKQPDPDVVKSARLIAHRGAHNHARGIIENTVPAFRMAQEAGCWGLELDVRMTADKVIVVNHDPTLERLWGRNVAIAEINFADLRLCEPNIPTLAEVVAEFGACMHLFIELKAPFCDEEALAVVLKDLIPSAQYHLLTLDPHACQLVTRFPREALLLVANYNNARRFCDLSCSEHYGGVLGHYLLLNDKLVQQLNAAQQHAGVGFVDSKYSLYRELNRGINWIFSNNVAKINSCLKALRF